MKSMIVVIVVVRCPSPPGLSPISAGGTMGREASPDSRLKDASAVRDEWRQEDVLGSRLGSS